MLFSKRTLLVVAAVLSAQAQAQSAREELQACIVNCSSTAATSVGCTGLTDINCYCAKQEFANEAGACAAKCPNYVDAALQAAFGQFEDTCKNASTPFTLTLPSGGSAASPTGSASSAPAASGTPANGSVTSAPAAATSAPAKDAAAGLVIPGLAAFGAAAAAAFFAL
ncbi:hypothetical protein FA09DRAFT_341400 [Tilletiopsis washingtonensis]|uniref:CFEM domain-containing protein n=1 Tax=Tilletiopsis washingtonensis TaxID=58919 RepID=A0A316Z274_9BASI|nr:hypothetical protein FA09DRAFT_341400 [Tilletiopsis washingtonensis]PWN95194.1 hypothetical protein FA09DRAFT_341400 [Tilletiopsis washingtonensis]